nr:ATP-citrate synthase alpha chain protein 3 [Ipomoea batatas]
MANRGLTTSFKLDPTCSNGSDDWNFLMICGSFCKPAKLVDREGGLEDPRGIWETTSAESSSMVSVLEYYLSIVSERLGCTISFSECGGVEIEENWNKVVKVVFIPTEKPMTLEVLTPLIATLPLECNGAGVSSTLFILSSHA